MGFFDHLTQLFSTFRVTDLIDILLISVLIYYIIILVKETRAEQLIKGFILLIVFSQISDWLNLYTVHWLLSNLLTVGLILVIVVFQPELRRAFERLGRSRGWLLSFGNNGEKERNGVADELVRACTSLSRQKIGALIVLENKTGLSELLDTGTLIDGLVSAELLINIFIPNTPLHDGAVIIRNDKVVAAGVFLPLTENKNLSRELGTRHRAAIGISERSDALVLVVSEETGLISVCQNGQIARRIDEESLREILEDFYTAEAEDSSINRMIAFFNRAGKGKDEKEKEKEKAKQEESAADRLFASPDSLDKEGSADMTPQGSLAEGAGKSAGPASAGGHGQAIGSGRVAGQEKPEEALLGTTDPPDAFGRKEYLTVYPEEEADEGQSAAGRSRFRGKGGKR